MDSTRNFSGLAAEYTAGRPVYAEAFLESLYARHGFSAESAVADIGSGTGKFAKQLLDRGSTVWCVEPNGDMRRTAVRELGGYAKFCAVNGTAAETTLADTSVDFITAAQAFHWFDVSAFQKECRRILKPGGRVFLIWNLRDMTDEMNRRCHAVHAAYCPAFQGFGGGIQKDDARIGQFFGGQYRYEEFDNPLFYDREKFLSRSLSGSYSLQQGDARYADYIGALSELFDEYAENGVLAMANRTVAYSGTL